MRCCFYFVFFLFGYLLPTEKPNVVEPSWRSYLLEYVPPPHCRWFKTEPPSFHYVCYLNWIKLCYNKLQSRYWWQICGILPDKYRYYFKTLKGTFTQVQQSSNNTCSHTKVHYFLWDVFFSFGHINHSHWSHFEFGRHLIGETKPRQRCGVFRNLQPEAIDLSDAGQRCVVLLALTTAHSYLCFNGRRVFWVKVSDLDRQPWWNRCPAEGSPPIGCRRSTAMAEEVWRHREHTDACVSERESERACCELLRGWEYTTTTTKKR